MSSVGGSDDEEAVLDPEFTTVEDVVEMPDMLEKDGLREWSRQPGRGSAPLPGNCSKTEASLCKCCLVVATSSSAAEAAAGGILEGLWRADPAASSLNSIVPCSSGTMAGAEVLEEREDVEMGDGEAGISIISQDVAVVVDYL